MCCAHHISLERKPRKQVCACARLTAAMPFFTRSFFHLPILNNRSLSFIPSTRSQSAVFFSTSAATRSYRKLSFIAAYLIHTVGLSPEEALKASKQIRHIRTPSKPDAVIQFLTQIGLDDAGIRNAVSRKPILLCTQVERTLKPKVLILLQAGFSEPEVARLISENPYFLHRKSFYLKIDFLRDFFTSKEVLLKALIKNTFILGSNLEKRILPNVSYLTSCGLPKDRVVQLMKCNHWLITRTLDYIKRAVQRAVDLGFVPESRMFYFALQSTCRNSKDSIDAKVGAIRSFGFSEAEISSAIRKVPQLLYLSVENIKSKMDFFVSRAGCDLSYLIAHPKLLCYSFEKRLIPRNRVMQVLKSRGLPKRKCGVFYCMLLCDRKFLDKFVLPYREEIPDLNQVYLSACDGKAPPVEDHLS